jgi:phosphatidylglycerol:prolipoprotein diacylglycerol transferase
VPPVLAAIPYTTFPSIELGPVTLRTFGIMVALGVVVGISVAARLGEQIGRPADDTINLGVKLVVAGVVGARITWVLTHLDQIDSPIDLIAVWEGGLQFSGGFIGAVLLGLPVFLRWDRLTRWRMLDRCMLGLAVGLAIGRIGCYAVGEHLGGPTSFPLASRYDGGSTREGNGGEGPPAAGRRRDPQHSLYEMLHVFVLSAVLWWLIRRRSTPGTAIGVFLVWIGVGRFATDFLRIYDDTVAGLTGAQLMCLVLVPVGLWALLWVRPRLAREEPPPETPWVPETSPRTWCRTTTSAAAPHLEAPHGRRPRPSVPTRHSRKGLQEPPTVLRSAAQHPRDRRGALVGSRAPGDPTPRARRLRPPSATCWAGA